MYYNFYLAQLYFLFSFYFLLLFLYNTTDYYIHFIYNYSLYLHISLILISYLLFLLLFIQYLLLYCSINIQLISSSYLGIIFTFYTLIIGILWGYSIWKTFTFFDIRILFILSLFLFYIFDYFIPLFNNKYKSFLFFILFSHFFILKIKMNWSSQIHQSNSFFSFFYHLPLIDVFSLFSLFSFIFNYILLLILTKEYNYSLKNNIVKNL